MVVCSRKAASVEATVAALRKEGLEVAGTACHVGDRSALQRLVQFTLDTYGQLDILVSNAAVNPAAGPIMTMEGGRPQRGQQQRQLRAPRSITWCACCTAGVPNWLLKLPLSPPPQSWPLRRS